MQCFVTIKLISVTIIFCQVFALLTSKVLILAFSFFFFCLNFLSLSECMKWWILRPVDVWKQKDVSHNLSVSVLISA